MSTDQHIQASAAPRTIESPEQFAAHLTTLRERLGVSIRQLARQTSVPSATLGGYFSGRHLPNPTQPQVLRSVLQALGVSEEDELVAWQDALLRVRKGVAKRTSTTSSAAAAPYRGLNAFTEEDKDVFFGRQSAVTELLSRVTALLDTTDQQRLLVVVGPSGCGKSSLLRAGLAAQLLDAAAVAVMVPGTNPVAALTTAVASLDAQNPASKVLIVDQAEELFSPEVTAEHRALFIRRITDLAAAGLDCGAVVVLGLRADFYGAAASEPDLLAALRNAQMLLGAMSLPDLREAITRPAEIVGVDVDPDLIDLLLRDLSPQQGRTSAYDAGALPLVSHAMLSTWKHHQGTRLTVNDYLAVGGLQGAVRQSAETVLGTFDARGVDASQWLFTQLVLVDDDGVMTRRRVQHDTLQHPDPDTDRVLDDVVEAFVAGRLLTADETTLEISHEALLTAWPRLHDWILGDLDAARLQSRISEAQRLWSENQEDPDLLLRGGPLLDAQALAASPPSSARTLTGQERTFVQASADRVAEQAAVKRRQAKRLRATVAVTTVLAIVATMLAGVALWSRGESEQQKALAEQARDEAQSAELAVTADSVRPRDPAAAAQLALAGYSVYPTVAARSSLLASTGVPTPQRLVGPAGEMHAVATADGELIAASGKDGVTRLWERSDTGDFVRGADLVTTAPASPGPIWASAFTPDGRTFIAADSDEGTSTLVFWDLSDPATPQQLGAQQVPDVVKAVVVSPDGATVTAGTAGGGIYRWSAGAGQRARPPVTGLGAEVTSLAYVPGSDDLIAGTSAGQLVTLRGPSLRTTAQVQVLANDSPTAVTSVAITADGETVLTGQKAGDIREWSRSGGGRLTQRGRPFGDFSSWVNGVSLGAGDQMVTAASSDGHVKVFTLPQRQEVADLPTPSAASAVQFVGNRLLTSEVGGVARVWPWPLPVLRGFGDAVWGIASDQSQTTLMVSAGVGDGAVRIYSQDPTEGPVLQQTLTSAQAGPGDGAAAMSGDARWVAAGTVDGHVAVWERGASGRYSEAGVVRSGKVIIENVAITRDGQYLAAVGDSGRLSVWRLRSGAAPELFATADKTGLGLGVAFDPAGQRIAVASSENTVHLWDLGAQGLTEAATLTGFANYVYGVAFDPSGTYLAAGSTDQTVRLWDVSTDEPTPVGGALEGPGGTLYSLAWNSDGTQLAAASKDGVVWLWDTSDPTAARVTARLAGPGGDLYSIAYGSGDTVMAGGLDQVVTMWESDVQDAADVTCTRTGEGLSAEEWGLLVPATDFMGVC